MSVKWTKGGGGCTKRVNMLAGHDNTALAKVLFSLVKGGVAILGGERVGKK